MRFMKRHGRQGLAKNNPSGVGLRGGLQTFAINAFRFVAGSQEPRFGQRPPSLAAWTSSGNALRSEAILAARRDQSNKTCKLVCSKGPGSYQPNRFLSNKERAMLQCIIPFQFSKPSKAQGEFTAAWFEHFRRRTGTAWPTQSTATRVNRSCTQWHSVLRYC